MKQLLVLFNPQQLSLEKAGTGKVKCTRPAHQTCAPLAASSGQHRVEELSSLIHRQPHMVLKTCTFEF
ncbi:hypothetical protein ACRRTK_012003 [Alexandromys fortis]